MKKFTDKILSATADAALEALLAAAGLASIGGSYQPEMPAKLDEVAKVHNKIK